MNSLSQSENNSKTSQNQTGQFPKSKMKERKALRDSQASLNNSSASITKGKDNIDKLVTISNHQLITDLFQAPSDM